MFKGVILVKKIVAGLALLLVLSACGSSEADKVSLKKDEFTVELGTKISFEPTVYLNTTKKEIIDSAKVTFDSFKASEQEEYLPTGAYFGQIRYKANGKDKTDKFIVRIKDTKRPEFEEFKDTINLKVGTIGEDLRKYYFAKDLSDVKIIIDDSKVDYNKVGKYEITVVAEDTSKNKNEKKANVIIFEEPKEESKVIPSETKKPDYACQNALYDKKKTCDYIPEDKLLPKPNVNFFSEKERDQYVLDNNLENVWTGYYQVSNNGKEKIMVWYVNTDKPAEENKTVD